MNNRRDCEAISDRASCVAARGMVTAAANGPLHRRLPRLRRRRGSRSSPVPRARRCGVASSRRRVDVRVLGEYECRWQWEAPCLIREFVRPSQSSTARRSPHRTTTRAPWPVARHEGPRRHKEVGRGKRRQAEHRSGDGARRPPWRSPVQLPRVWRPEPPGDLMGRLVPHLRPARAELSVPGAQKGRRAEQLLPAGEPEPGGRLIASSGARRRIRSDLARPVRVVGFGLRADKVPIAPPTSAASARAHGQARPQSEHLSSNSRQWCAAVASPPSTPFATTGRSSRTEGVDRRCSGSGGNTPRAARQSLSAEITAVWSTSKGGI